MLTKIAYLRIRDIICRTDDLLYNRAAGCSDCCTRAIKSGRVINWTTGPLSIKRIYSKRKVVILSYKNEQNKFVDFLQLSNHTFSSNIRWCSGDIDCDAITAGREFFDSDPSNKEFGNFSFPDVEDSDLENIVLRIDKYLLSNCKRLCFWLGVLVSTL